MKNYTKTSLNDASDITPGTAHSVVPDNDEYYTLDLDRTPDEGQEAPFDIASSSDDTSVTGSSSFYDGTVVPTDSSDDAKYSDQNTVSAEVGNPGHWGIDEGTEE